MQANSRYFFYICKSSVNQQQMKKKFPIISLLVILVAGALILYDPSIVGKGSKGTEMAENEYAIKELFGKNAKAATIAASSATPDEFIKGMDSFSTFCRDTDGEKGATLRFSHGDESFTAACLWFNGSAHVVIEDSEGNRSLVFSEGKLDLPSTAPFSYPKIGFASSEKSSNRYMIGVHDFTDEGYPEFLIAVKDADEGVGFFVLEYSGGKWAPIGEIVSKGKGLGGGRIFRQAFTLKNSSGTMFSWTCHDHRFDFLSSDHVTKQTDLF